MIDQQIDTIEIRLMRLERANHRLAWLFGTAVAIAAISASMLGTQILDAGWGTQPGGPVAQTDETR